jgi:FlaA1/EpsC-like NDP-sugar epimerase
LATQTWIGLQVGARRAAIIAVHLVLWTAALAIAFLLRFEFAVPHGFLPAVAVWLPVLLIVRVGTFGAMGLFRGVWRYTGARDAIAIVEATTISSLVVLAFLVVAIQGFPRSVVAIEWLAALALVGGSRFAIRAMRAPSKDDDAPEEALRVIIIGAGDAGEMLVRELLQSRQARRFHVVGFLDDDEAKKGAHIHGVRVLGQIDLLKRFVALRNIQEALIAIPTASGTQMRRIVDVCKEAGVRFKTIPGIENLIDGRVAVSSLRDVAIEDLLGREPVQLDMAAISAEMEGHVVMVSGAGGSIGSELSRQVCRFRPSSLVLVERTENNLFHIHRELLSSSPDVRVVPCVADISDGPRMRDLFAAHRPTIVFHAAAHKHVPMMEWNPGEAVKNNVLGTKTLADLADEHGVQRFVMISTDKAVNPTSVMGVSKRVAEIYVQALSQRSRTRFVAVRFGNVLGSAGSVIPIFKEQIAAGGPVTVTHPEMKRYFMTIPEASQLVLQAGTMGQGGEIFVLDMGQPVKIADLARDLITLSGLKPGEDVEVRFTGLRPGEKLFEELSLTDENADRTLHPKIFVGRLRPHPMEEVVEQIRRLAATAAAQPENVRACFAEIVPEFRPQGPIRTPFLSAEVGSLRVVSGSGAQ